MKDNLETCRDTGNVLNPKKLHNSKWTAVNPDAREKHFVVIEVNHDENGAITHCLIEAVISRRSFAIEWRTLGKRNEWLSGWR